MWLRTCGRAFDYYATTRGLRTMGPGFQRLGDDLGAHLGGDDRERRRPEGVAEVTPFDWFLRLHTPAGRATHLGLGDRRVHASKRREGPRLFTRRALTAGASMSARLVSA